MCSSSRVYKTSHESEQLLRGQGVALFDCMQHFARDGGGGVTSHRPAGPRRDEQPLGRFPHSVLPWPLYIAAMPMCLSASEQCGGNDYTPDPRAPECCGTPLVGCVCENDWWCACITASTGPPSVDTCHAAGAASRQRTAKLRGDRSQPWWKVFGSTADDAAAAIVDNMTLAERLQFVQGAPWGPRFERRQAAGVNRLLVPSIQLQDGPQGFRTLDPRQLGQVTAFPCLLSAAATWDANLVERFAGAIGAEFRTKGANLLLGPGVNLHRVALGGRAAEYLTGEEPTLGAVMAAAYVRGAQAAGVGCVVKHWILNNQEDGREGTNACASDRTLHEIYFPPFVAAVRAGAAAIMCSFNKVNGTHACEDVRTMTILRRFYGFKGFVMSDWKAIADTEVAASPPAHAVPRLASAPCLASTAVALTAPRALPPCDTGGDPIGRHRPEHAGRRRSQRGSVQCTAPTWMTGPVDDHARRHMPSFSCHPRASPHHRHAQAS